MLEAALRPDGSIISVAAFPAGDDRSAGGGQAIGGAAPAGDDDRSVFPLDGLPLGREAADRGGSPLGSGSEGWTGGFAFALRDRERETLHAYRDH